jgi:tetratricopeptide (TPR) repeat protein
MQRRSLATVPLLTAIFVLLLSGITAVTAQSIEQIEYWRKRYPELTSAQDPRAARAHAILAQLVQVAGKRDIEPRLFITAREPLEMVPPIAIQDGWIILSKGVLDICYRESTWGEHRLAFVLAHELAHHLQNDLWHLRLLDVLETPKTRSAVPPAFLDKFRESTETPGHVFAREVQADQHGMLYAAMAGFAPAAIVSADQGVNFFVDWVRALDPRRLDTQQVRPTLEGRAEALRTLLREIANQSAAFQAGLWWYYAGDYPQAIQAFDTFRTAMARWAPAVFAGREVYQNLAASHHQLALQAYRAWHPTAPPFPFQLAVTIDPLTRASQVYLERTRGQSAEPAAQFRQHLEAAMRWYREALALDPRYTLAAGNLGAALLLHAAHPPKAAPHPDVVEAVSLLTRALEQAPQDPNLLTTLGVAWWYDERPERARQALAQATTLAPTLAAPVFNLGVLARLEHRDTGAQRYPAASAQLTASPAPAPASPRPSAETVAGMRPGMPEHDAPASWGRSTRSEVKMDGKLFTVATYPAGIMTLTTQHGEILMLSVRDGYRGTSTQGIALGSPANEVLARYGPPTRRHDLPRGQSWAYEAHRIAFQLRDGQVVSWLRF